MKTLALVVVLLALAGSVRADWPRYRGADFSGISTETGLNFTWPAEGPRQLWQAALGPGGSSVVVANGRLYTMGNVENNDIVYCLDALTGKEIWRYSYPTPLDRRSFEGGPAGTPTLDGDRLYTVSHRNLVHCLDAATGKVIWTKDLMKEFKGKRPQWGYSCSPLVDGDVVVFDNGGEGTSTVVLRKSDGELVWAAGDHGASYSSAVPARLAGRKVYLIFKARAIVAQDAATGAEVWQHPWRTSWDVHSALPIVKGAEVFISSGYKRGAALLKIGATGPTVVWEKDTMCNQMNSSVLIDGHLYGVSGDDGAKATLRCIEWATGELKWEYKGLNCGSLKAADGKLIVLSEKGELVVAPISPKEFAPVARAQVLNGRCWVVPVLVNGILYCRSNLGTLVALDLRPGAAATTAAAESFATDFEQAELDKLPAEFSTDAAALVKEADGNKFLEFPGEPAENVTAQFGPAGAAGWVVTARAWGARKGRTFPQFGVSLGGLRGFRLQVAPGRKAVELLQGDAVKATAPVEWTSEQWTWLKLQVREAKPGAWVVAGKAWSGDTEPAEWTVTLETTEAPATGKAGLWSAPFSNTPIRFDDVSVNKIAAP